MFIRNKFSLKRNASANSSAYQREGMIESLETEKEKGIIIGKHRWQFPSKLVADQGRADQAWALRNHV